MFPPLPPDARKPPRDPRDFRGIWAHYQRDPQQLRTIEGQPPPYTPEAGQSQARLWQALRGGKPVANDAVMCRPPGFLWTLGISLFPMRIVQTDGELLILFDRFHQIWRIELNQPIPAHLSPSRGGYSVGHWEEDALVVDTVGLLDGTGLDESGSRLSDAAHLVTRISKRADGWELVFRTTIDDPKTYTRPWTIDHVWSWRPDYFQLSEHDCEQSAGTLQEAKQYGYSVEDARRFGYAQP
jgi:hypothetical protein